MTVLIFSMATCRLNNCCVVALLVATSGSTSPSISSSVMIESSPSSAARHSVVIAPWRSCRFSMGGICNVLLMNSPVVCRRIVVTKLPSELWP